METLVKSEKGATNYQPCNGEAVKGRLSAADSCGLIGCDKVQHLLGVGLRAHCGRRTAWTKSIMTLIPDE